MTTPPRRKPGRFRVLDVSPGLVKGSLVYPGIGKDDLFAGVPGRMEAVDEGQPFNVLVDYAHTDDALRNALDMLRPVTPGRLLVVFGCGGGCTVTDPAGTVPGTFRIDGNPLPQAPKHVYNLTARYGIPLGNAEFFVYTDWAYRSKVNFFLYESTEFTGGPLLEGGLRLGVNWKDGRYEVAAYGRNITDEEAIVGAIGFNNLTGFLNEPRTWGVEFKATF